MELSRVGPDDPQSPMPVQPGEVMHVFEGISESSIRVVQRFLGRARLYRLKPNFELVRKWERQECTVLEIPNVAVEDGKLKSICIGGRLGSLREGNCIPNQSVKCRSQLIGVLAEYEWQGRIPNAVTDRIISCDACDIPHAVLIVSNDGVKAALSKQIPFSLECGDVVCRSTEPAPTIFEPGF